MGYLLRLGELFPGKLRFARATQRERGKLSPGKLRFARATLEGKKGITPGQASLGPGHPGGGIKHLGRGEGIQTLTGATGQAKLARDCAHAVYLNAEAGRKKMPMNSATPHRVMIVDADYQDGSMATAVDAVFDAFPLEVTGKRVLVKPNILGGHRPEKAVTTHPSLVAAVVARLKAGGAEVMVGDNSGVHGYGRSDEAARVSGIMAAAGDSFIHLGGKPVRHELPGRDIGHAMISKDVLAADLVVNLPKLKTHGLTFYTGAVKNTFGYVTGGDKMRIHAQAVTPRRFAEALVDIYAIRPPELNIMDAVEAMEGNGPSNGRPRRVGKILASDNAVCLDATALRLVGKDPQSIPHLAVAAARGLGSIDAADIVVSGDMTPVRDFVMPATFVPGLMGIVLNRFLSRWINCLPEIDETACKRCGLCSAHCPTGAMTISPGEYPRADKTKCISCYCCQEMCPENAIVLRGRVIRRLQRAMR
jgi:uncharacterized protein (DUF362 family)/ferredoxin